MSHTFSVELVAGLYHMYVCRIAMHTYGRFTMTDYPIIKKYNFTAVCMHANIKGFCRISHINFVIGMSLCYANMMKMDLLC